MRPSLNSQVEVVHIPEAIKELEAQQSCWKWHSQLLLVIIAFASLVGAFVNWYLTTLIGVDSLGTLAQQLEEVLGHQVEAATKEFMTPNSVMARQGYEMAYQMNWDLTAREGQFNMAHYRSAFLRAYPGDLSKC
jgi:hypothetical protein